MQREHYLARLLRALSGKSQRETGAEIGVDPSLVSQIELGQVLPRPAYLARLATTASLTLEAAEEIMSFAEERRRAGMGRGRREPGLARLGEALKVHIGSAELRLKALPGSDSRPAVASEELYRRVYLALREESERAASHEVELAAVLAQAAQELQP